MARLAGALQDGSYVLAERYLAWRRQLVGIRAKRRGLRHACKRYKEEDRKALREAGFTDRDIWDIAAVAGFFNMSNRIATATDMRLNSNYHSQKRV